MGKRVQSTGASYKVCSTVQYRDGSSKQQLAVDVGGARVLHSTRTVSTAGTSVEAGWQAGLLFLISHLL
jgi:hypothetical protein